MSKKTKEIKLMIIENFIDHYTSHEATREKMKMCAFDYVEEDHVDEIEQADFFSINKELTKTSIFLVKHEGFPEDYYAICTKIEPYDPILHSKEMFTFHNSIIVNKPVTRNEAELLLEIIKHNGSGKLCGGKPLEIIELR